MMDDVREELQRRVLEQSAVARLGELALESSDPGALMDAAAETVAATLDVRYAGVMELDATGDCLVSRPAHGGPADVRDHEFAFS